MLPEVGLIQTQDAAAGGRLAAAAFTHQSQRLILLYLKTDIIDGFNIPYFPAE